MTEGTDTQHEAAIEAAAKAAWESGITPHERTSWKPGLTTTQRAKKVEEWRAGLAAYDAARSGEAEGEREAWHIRICECGFPLGATLAVLRLLTCPDCGRRVVPVEDATRSVDVVAALAEHPEPRQDQPVDRASGEGTSAFGDLHVGRSWDGHPLEDDCPCPKEPCGLVSLSRADPACEQHSGMKTIRQSHSPSDCPGPVEHPETGERDDAMLVYCTYCHKTHAVGPLETPCAPGAWTDHRIPAEPLQDGAERELGEDEVEALILKMLDYELLADAEDAERNRVIACDLIRTLRPFEHPHQDVDLSHVLAFCIECGEEGKRQRVEHRFGAWLCPTHRDRCHVRFERPGTHQDVERERDNAFELLGEEGDSLRAALTKWQESQAEVERLREALGLAESGLRDARDGLDFGLGHARTLESDKSPVPIGPRSKQMDAYLKRARIAHAGTVAALAPSPDDRGGER